MTKIEFIASEIRENRIEYARLRKELQEAIDNDAVTWQKTLVVKTQKMFPNCQKYTKCCKDSGYEETIKKTKNIKDFDKQIKKILSDVKHDV